MAVFTIQQVHETVQTIYQELFTVKFEHPGFETPNENFISRVINLVPDTATRTLFDQYKIDYRFNTNTLVCFIECTLVNPPNREPKIPFLDVPTAMQMRFLVKAGDDFVGRTYVVATGSTKTYQVSNTIDNTGGGLLFLTAPVESYSAANDYEIGTIVQNGPDLFAALKTVLAADGIPITNTVFWKQLPGISEVMNNADLKSNATVKADSTCFAVIDIQKTGTTNNSYKIFDAGDELFTPAPVFTIRFKSKP